MRDKRVRVIGADLEVQVIRRGKKVELRLVAMLSPKKLLEFMDDLRLQAEEVVSRMGDRS